MVLHLMCCVSLPYLESMSLWNLGDVSLRGADIIIQLLGQNGQSY